MKTPLAYTFTIVSLVLSSASQVTAQLNDDFSDGEIQSNPSWSGMNDHFTVSSGELQLSAPPQAGNSWIVAESKAVLKGRWEFTLRMNFATSSTSYARVYLMSDSEDLGGPLNGYYVLIGDTEDEVSLVKQTGTTHAKVIDGEDKRIDMPVVNLRVLVTRDDEGNWSLESDINLSGTVIMEGTAHDQSFLTSRYFGLYCHYIASRSTLFYFDDIVASGESYPEPEASAPKDVIISEIFADPSPTVGLPDQEYVEIYNRSNKTFHLAGWSINDNTTAGTLSGILRPQEYKLLVAGSGLSAFSHLENSLGVANFPSINNDGEAIMLRDATGNVIDSVNFKDTWYQQSSKREGGWSLEIIDVDNVCSDEQNWSASEDPSGGTPGRANAIAASKPDLTPPLVTNVMALSEQEILVIFNEKLERNLPNESAFIIEPAVETTSVRFVDQSLRSLLITTAAPLEKGILYNLTINEIADCAGNKLSTTHIDFALPEQALPTDVVINEILFNPWPTGVDFVEVYNKSEKYVDITGWKLASFDDTDIENVYPLNTNLILKPHQYLVFTTDVSSLKSHYSKSIEENCLKVNFPSLPDDEGSIILLDEGDEIIDAFRYTKDHHSSFIKDEEGVSLERVSFALRSDDPQNWKSCAATAGFATPGYVNSNTRSEITFEDESIKVEPEIFQPIYGSPDFATISYKFDQGGFVANVKIFDAYGRLIKQVANNEVLGVEGFYRWEGDRDDGSKARIGSYTVWFEVFDSGGNVKTYKNRVVVATRF